MSELNRRWKELTAAARTVADSEEELPFGFVTRVMALGANRPSESWEDLASALGVRALLVTGLVAVAASGFSLFDWYETRLERPPFEQSLTSEIPWP